MTKTSRWMLRLVDLGLVVAVVAAVVPDLSHALGLGGTTAGGVAAALARLACGLTSRNVGT